MADYGGCRFEEIDIGKLDIARDVYQREFRSTRLNKMVKEWDWTKCGVITVGRRSDGTFWIDDGQHRTMAASKLGYTTMPCWVFDSEGEKQEARYFVEINTGRTMPSVPQRFRAEIVYGNEISVDIANILDKHGFKWNTGGKPGKSMRCITEIKRCYSKKDGAKLLDDTLTILDDLYFDTNVDVKVFKAIYHILYLYNVPSFEALHNALVLMGRNKLYSICTNAEYDEGYPGRWAPGSKCAAAIIDVLTKKGSIYKLSGVSVKPTLKKEVKE